MTSAGSNAMPIQEIAAASRLRPSLHSNRGTTRTRHAASVPTERAEIPPQMPFTQDDQQKLAALCKRKGIEFVGPPIHCSSTSPTARPDTELRTRSGAEVRSSIDLRNTMANEGGSHEQHVRAGQSKSSSKQASTTKSAPSDGMCPSPCSNRYLSISRTRRISTLSAGIAFLPPRPRGKKLHTCRPPLKDASKGGGIISERGGDYFSESGGRLPRNLQPDRQFRRGSSQLTPARLPDFDPALPRLFYC